MFDYAVADMLLCFVMNEINVILVEDDNSFRTCLSELLELSGISTKGVGCAMEFYQAINAGAYDVAIIDIGLPDQSGLRIVEFLRENSNVGIILLSGHAQASDRVEGYNCGADHYFVKPVETSELVGAIRNLHERLLSIPPDDKHESDIGEWSLDKISWILTSPEGRQVNMTAKEMTFMAALMNCAGENVSRQTLNEMLDYQSSEYGNRSMDAMVRRLRKKSAQELQEHLPVQTIHAIGYCFSSPATVLTGN